MKTEAPAKWRELHPILSEGADDFYKRQMREKKNEEIFQEVKALAEMVIASYKPNSFGSAWDGIVTAHEEMVVKAETVLRKLEE